MKQSGDGSAFVTLKELGFEYRIGSVKVPVLANLSIEFERSKITAIVGRSGCGKTTLLKSIAGLVQPNAGNITIDGVPLSGVRKETAIIFQDFGLLPWADVISNAELGLKIAGTHAGKRKAKVDPILAEVGLAGSSTLFPARLSGGMRQRVAIARALASESDLLLLDEPFSSLDALTRESLQDSLLEAQRVHGTTIILVTHSIEEAAYLADRVYIMEGRNPASVVKGIDTARRRAGTAPIPEKQRHNPVPATNSLDYRENPLYFSDVSELRELFESRSTKESGLELARVAVKRNLFQAHRLPGKLARLAGAIGVVLAAWALLAAALGKPFLPGPEAAFARFAQAAADG